MIRLKPDEAYHNIYGSSAVHFSKSPGGQEWKVVRLQQHTGAHHSSLTGIAYPDLITHVQLQRRSHFYYWKARFPLQLAMLMECTGFSVHPVDIDGISYRLSSSVSVFFSMIAIQLAIQAY